MQIDHQKIKQTRVTKGWTQQQLSEICGLSVRTIQRVENQQHASMETLSTLSSVFDIPREEFLTSKANFTRPALSPKHMWLIFLSGISMGLILGAVSMVLLTN